MSAARARVVARGSLLREAAGNSDLISKPPVEIRWNEHARLVRLALCINAFTALEEFIQRRIQEVLLELIGIPPNSQGIPNAMKTALIKGALDSLIFRIKEHKRYGISDTDAYILSHVSKIASSSGAGLDPSELTLANNGSNLSWKTIEDALTAFSVDNPLSIMNGVARRIDGGIFVAKDHFESVLEWRHKAAHLTDTDIPLADITEHVKKLILFCASFDILISTGASRIKAAAYALGPTITKGNDVKLRFVEYNKGQWRDIPENKTRAHSRNLDKNSIISSSELIAQRTKECVIVRLESRTSPIESWSIPFIH